MGITTPKGSSLEGDQPGVAYDGRQLLKNYMEKVVTNAVATGVISLDLSLSNVHELTLTGNISPTFDNPAIAGESSSLTLIVTQDATGGRTITWPGSVKWAGGTAPVLTTTANAVSILTFFTTDAGTTWYGFSAGDNFS